METTNASSTTLMRELSFIKKSHVGTNSQTRMVQSTSNK